MTRVLLGYVVWLVAIGGVRRLYWWSPLVLLMIESTCDRRSAAHWSLRAGDHVIITRAPTVHVLSLLCEIRRPSDGWCRGRERPVPEDSTAG